MRINDSVTQKIRNIIYTPFFFENIFSPQYIFNHLTAIIIANHLDTMCVIDGEVNLAILEAELCNRQVFSRFAQVYAQYGNAKKTESIFTLKNSYYLRFKLKETTESVEIMGILLKGEKQTLRVVKKHQLFSKEKAV